ncbi:RNA polymerase alpha subunit C-terminal domain-containing protein [Niabella sp. W65]|nr:RNA polymerase alpha subunit C-terminal domain-containing protein [Niabella sp. W65]MCH7368155.1 RNA polymerase alpha subunit C-terminal domain-containing protein [Niabella sp. W65]ULT43772.1 RNA polymerase alpha subunit C-terminal domain-containing protein [Niabella sp. I65]
MAKTLRTCSNGHQYYKSSGCPVCPECEKQVKPGGGFLADLSAPARRALETAGITSLQQLATYSEKEILKLHGMGKASLPLLRTALKSAGIGFKP